MEGLLVLLGLYLSVVLVILPIITVAKLVNHTRMIDALGRRNRELEAEVGRLNALILANAKASGPTPAPLAPSGSPPGPVQPPTASRPLVEAVPARAVEPRPARSEPPPLAAPPIMAREAVSPPTPIAAQPRSNAAETVSEGPGRAFNWEQFIGAKLFAWLGGLALFLCVAFFVKYSFEHDLIPPQVRVALGFLLGVGLIVGGLMIAPQRYRVTAQTLVASGVVSLYAVTFACGSIYHFAFFGPIPSFLLMALVTGAAFLIAVRRDAQVVA